METRKENNQQQHVTERYIYLADLSQESSAEGEISIILEWNHKKDMAI